MINYRMIISYEGTGYQGWQRQGNTENTVQGVIEGSLGKLFGEKVEIHGSGRTDAGVHARAQNAHFKIDRKYDTERLRTELNNLLPEDIKIRVVKEAGIHFHSRYDVRGKKYIYYVDTREKASVFHRKYSYHIPEELNLEMMREAARMLEGKYDFRSFSPMSSKREDTVRTIYKINISQKDGIIKMEFYGNGFLYQMVRILTGTLIEAGQGKRDESNIETVLEKKNRAAAGPAAPPHGLFLWEVFYD